MDTFMDKLAEKLGGQTAAEHTRTSILTGSKEQQEKGGNIIKKQQLPEPLSEPEKQVPVVFDDSRILEEIKNVNEAQREELVSIIRDGNSKQVELIAKISADVKEKDSELTSNIQDSVHKESVKCYRNIQAVLLEQVAVLEEKIKEQEKALKPVRIYFTITIAILLLNFGALLLYLLGIL